MKGLLIKDFLNLKKNFKIFGILTLIYGFMAFTSGDSSFFSTIFTMLFAIMTLSLYSYDDMAKWDSYALTMPISKDMIVQGKYLMMLLLTFIGATFSILITIIICLTSPGKSLLPAFQSCGIVSAIVIIFYSLTIPIITKLGVEKARIILFAAYLIPFAIVMLLKKAVKNFTISDDIMEFLQFIQEYSYIIIPIVILLILGVSYLISIRIYRKKEL